MKLSRLKKKFEIEETSNSDKFLNIIIKTLKSGLGMSQAEYIEKLLDKYNMRECNLVITPIFRMTRSI